MKATNRLYQENSCKYFKDSIFTPAIANKNNSNKSGGGGFRVINTH